MEGMNKEVSKEQLLHSNENGSANNNQVSEANLLQGQVQDPNMDPKKIKRALASRKYSQRYRLKQLQYIKQLEEDVKKIQADLQIKAPSLRLADHQHSLLRAENDAIRQQLQTCSHELMLKEAEYENLKKERNFLEQLYNQQQLQPESMEETLSENFLLPVIGSNQLGFNPFMEPAAVPETSNQNGIPNIDPGQFFDVNSINQLPPWP